MGGGDDAVLQRGGLAERLEGEGVDGAEVAPGELVDRLGGATRSCAKSRGDAFRSRSPGSSAPPSTRSSGSPARAMFL